jgi:uncharacterized protein YjbI with pentapeptide repeats
MVASNSKRSKYDTKFTKAEKDWNLEQLYAKLTVAKQRYLPGRRKVLTPLEKCRLRGLLCGYSAEQIAMELDNVVGTVNDALCKGLYRYIEEFFNEQTEEPVKKIEHWGDVAFLLEKAGYKIQVSEQFPPSHPLPNKKENILDTSQKVEANSIREWRFKSVDQLWSKDIGECIAGIRKLERIAKDYPTEHWAIMEELAEFIRIKAPRQEGEEERSPKLLDDVQAALRVIGGRDWNLPIQPLDLSNTQLRGANLKGANLQGANLNRTNLQKVTLIAANLQRATLKKANLQRAIMHKAILQRANFTEANLQEADLDMTDLEEAELWSTNLQGTRLRSAYLQRAKLIDVNLQGAFLWDNDWQGVVFSGVNLRGADLRRAKNLELQEIAQAFGDSMTVLPENVARPAHWI